MPADGAVEISDRARRLYRDAIIIDTHNDLVTKVLDEGYDPAVRHSPAQGHTDVPRLIESGVTAQVLAAWVDAPYAQHGPGASFARALAYADAIHALVDAHPAALCFATSAEHVRRAKVAGKVAIFLGVEGGHAIEDSLDNLRELKRRGACYLTLTWNNGNAWAGSSIGSGDTRTAGLTQFGRDVIAELNRLGMLVDVSHTSSETLADVLGASQAPVIASHSSARALADHPRNLSDEELRAIAAQGGVICVNFYSRFIEVRVREAMDAAEARVEAEPAGTAAQRSARLEALLERIPPTPLSILIDHIDHVARVAGIDHVGLGSDFDGIRLTPAGAEDVTAYPRIAQALLDRGYADDDVRMVLGANVLRLMDDVLGADA
ncbi:MAG TPA: dipeptidase [Gemmatimonadaceae bacterium]|nr:dipeptidase [Gemmatimonadaceae bacterium]